MTYKTVAVSLNDIQNHAKAIESAAQLASNFDAQLIGLYVVPSAEIYGTGFDVMPVVFEGRRDYFRGASEMVKKAFGGVAARNDFRLIDAPNPDIAGQVAANGRSADIVVLTQPEHTEKSMLESDFVERVLLSIGRPTILLPRSGKTNIIPDLAIVGWDGGRESARAIFDSIPLLKRAKRTVVVWIDPQKGYPSLGGLPCTEIAEALARHGIDVALEPLVSGGRGAGEALLTKTADSGADLLVMGAYGHSRLKEFILGGATRSVLDGMKCPVFFSH